MLYYYLVVAIFPQLAKPTLKMWKILLACADPDVDREVNIFREQGDGFYKIDQTDDFAKAVSIAAAREFDVYIIDGGSQQLAGLSFCNLVRGWDEDGVIVFLSDNEGDKTDALNSGADIYLLKPRDIHKITTVIDDLLDYERAASVISQRL